MATPKLDDRHDDRRQSGEARPVMDPHAHRMTDRWQFFIHISDNEKHPFDRGRRHPVRTSNDWKRHSEQQSKIGSFRQREFPDSDKGPGINQSDLPPIVLVMTTQDPLRWEEGSCGPATSLGGAAAGVRGLAGGTRCLLVAHSSHF